MKIALATLSAIALVATPIYAASAAPAKTATKTAAKTTPRTTTKTAAKTTPSVAKQAKAEGESVKTEAKEVRHHAAAKHKYGKYERCRPSHMASSHHKATTHHKAAAKPAATKG